MSLIQGIKNRIKQEVDHRQQVGAVYREARAEADIKYAKERAVRDSKEKYMPPARRSRQDDRLDKIQRVLGGGESKNLNAIIGGGSGGGRSKFEIPGMRSSNHEPRKKKSRGRRIIIEG